MVKVATDLKRVAVFVEGLTEQMFVTKLFEEVLTNDKLAIINTKMTGGSTCPINIRTIRAEVEDENTEYYILIVDCSGDGTVKSYMLDQRQSLIDAGYSVILGLLDLFPRRPEEFHRKLMGLLYGVPQKPIPIKFTLSIAEIESWFIGEASHFLNIDPALTCQLIDDNIGYDPSVHNVEEIEQPSSDLNDIYQIVGKNYIKNKDALQETIDALDYSEIYFALPNRIPSLSDFISKVNEALD